MDRIPTELAGVDGYHGDDTGLPPGGRVRVSALYMEGAHCHHLKVKTLHDIPQELKNKDIHFLIK